MEEKILSMLTQISLEMAAIESELSEVHADVKSIKLYQENVLDDNIKLFIDNVSSVNETLNSIKSDITEIKESQVVLDILSEFSESN